MMSITESFVSSTNSWMNQKDLINSIIHDLRNPLNAIIGFSTLIKQEIGNPKSTEECLDFANEIEKAALDLNELICDLLESRVSGYSDFAVNLKEEIDVTEIIKRCVKLNYSFASIRKIKIKSKIDPDLPKIKLDEKRIKQILCNLISIIWGQYTN